MLTEPFTNINAFNLNLYTGNVDVELFWRIPVNLQGWILCKQLGFTQSSKLPGTVDNDS